MRGTICLAAVAVLLLQTPLISAQKQKESLRVSGIVMDGANGTIEFDLLNPGKKTVTAWSLWMTATFPDGTTRGAGVDQDEYLAFELADFMLNQRSNSGPIAPGGTYHERLQVPIKAGMRASKVEVEVRGAIFADASWQGDEKALGAIFDRRRTEFRELGRWVDEFEKTAQQFDGEEGLADLKAKIDAAPTATSGERLSQHAAAKVQKSELADIVTRTLHFVRSSSSYDSGQALDDLAAFVRRKHEAARKHLRSPAKN